ncbi:DUF1294 domain-containing protein [Methanoculleus sp. Wushi-C6]|uniref:DUF1294 domain-containing protein n=1 Tax=Methanoculleus caldifontis TaxID=2651577 RepID=A0ABU3X0L5_9EURY|nr:DUF1294 domain-containing protein [Methanoculleus sp. Wushi-C6]MDV2481172.1 DUF1294 domain-containing protein [Methanoculleus sp. Wushi-C6]
MILIAATAYFLVNAAAFVAYGRDKQFAAKGARRTPERRLLGLALIGPFGALAAMRLFRHKTQKGKFRLVPVFLCLHLALFAALALGLAG